MFGRGLPVSLQALRQITKGEDMSTKNIVKTSRGGCVKRTPLPRPTRIELDDALDSLQGKIERRISFDQDVLNPAKEADDGVFGKFATNTQILTRAVQRLYRLSSTLTSRDEPKDGAEDKTPYTLDGWANAQEQEIAKLNRYVDEIGEHLFGARWVNEERR
jgi:hypothetical protein